MKNNFPTTEKTPFMVFHPGEMLKDELIERNLTQADFSEITCLAPRTVNEIIKGKKSISPEIATAIGAALGTSPDFWLGMQADFDIFELKKKSTKKEGEIRGRSELYSLFPISELIRRKYLPNKKNVEELSKAVLGVLGIENFEQFKENNFAFFRTSQAGDIIQNYLWTWVLLGKQKSLAIKVKDYDPEGLKSFALSIKSYSLKPNGTKEVIEKLNDLGVRVLFLPHFIKTRVDGAATWISSKEPLIIMSLRYDRIDNFYFTLLHEIGHIILHSSGQKSFVDDMNNLGNDKIEKEANEFAINAMGLEGVNEELKFTRLDVNTLRFKAKETNIHPGILIGFLQHEKILEYNQFRQGLVKVRETIPAALQLQ